MALFAPWQLGQIDPGTMRFDPAGYFKRLGQTLGAVGEDPLTAEPSAPTGLQVIGQSATSAPQGMSIAPVPTPGAPTGVSAQPGGYLPTSPLTNPGGYLAEALGQTTTSQALREVAEQDLAGIQPSYDKSSKDLAKKDSEAEGAKIVPPAMQETLKAAKIKDPDMSMMMKLIPQGINPLTNPKRFLEHFGATSEQNNMARSWGPLESIRDFLSPDARALKARQVGLLQVGTFLTQKILESEAARLGAPQTTGDISALGNAVPLTPEQQAQKVEGPVAPGQLGPGAGITDPNQQLQPWQQDTAMGVLKSLAGGQLMQEPGGIVPTTLVAQQGRMITPQMAVEADRMARAPYSQDIQPPSIPLPALVVDKIISERGQMARDAAKDARAQNKPAELEKRTEEKALSISRQVLGTAMGFRELNEKYPELAAQAYREVHVDEPKEVYNYQQDALSARQLRDAPKIAYSQTTGRAEAELDQPAPEPQLWRDPFTGEAAKAGRTTRELQSKHFVKLRPDQVETVNQLATIDEGLNKVKEISRKLLRPEKGSMLANMLGALGQTAYLAALRATGNKDMLELDRNIAFLTAPLVKSQGDTANIAVAERDMIKQALVNNQASVDSVVNNIDGLQESIKRARGMMGFADPKELVERMLDAGMNEAQIKEALTKKGIIKKK